MSKIAVGSVLAWFWIAAAVQAAPSPTPRPGLECKTLNPECAVCADGRIYKKPGGEELKMSLYQCALKGGAKKTANVAQLQNCVTLSAFCAVCANGKYAFVKDGSEIDSDPWECVTRPRTRLEQ